MGEIKIPDVEETVRQIASGPEDEFIVTQTWEDQYKEYLESQKDLLVQMLLSGDPLSELDRQEIAHLLDPSLYDPSLGKRGRGRPSGTTKTRHKRFKIALEYESLYSTGGSESAIATLQEKYGFRDRSSIIKAISEVKKFRKALRGK